MINPNPPINRPKLSADPSFKIFAGLIFLIPSIAAAVWVYWCFNGTAYYSKERGILEGAICSVVSLLFFANALRLFVGAFKNRNIKPEYAPLDRRTISIPASRVEVKYKRLYDVLFAFLTIFFGGMALLIFLQTIRSPYANSTTIIVQGILFPAALFLILLVIAFLMIRARRQAVREFDESGITRGDGRRFAWNEFRGVVTLVDFNVRTRQKYVWRIELAFDGGEAAWIIPQRVKNADEVFDLLAQMPRATLEN